MKNENESFVVKKLKKLLEAVKEMTPEEVVERFEKSKTKIKDEKQNQFEKIERDLLNKNK